MFCRRGYNLRPVDYLRPVDTRVHFLHDGRQTSLSAIVLMFQPLIAQRGVVHNKVRRRALWRRLRDLQEEHRMHQLCTRHIWAPHTRCH